MSSDAMSYEVEIADVADGGNVPDLSPREARERWLNKLRVSKSEATVSSYHYRTKHFVEWCEDNGIDAVADVTGWELESFETHRREQGLKPVTLSKELLTLRNFLRYCARIELVDEDLPEKVVPPDVPRMDHVDETRLHQHDAKALLEFFREHADPRVRHGRDHVMLALMWYTGARLGAIRGLDLGDYDPDAQCVEFYHRPREDTPLKNGTGGERVVGLPDVVCETVDAYIEDGRHDIHDDYGRPPLITSQVGRPNKNTIRQWTYLATLPCQHSECPHGNERDTCEFVDYSKASQCPSSRSPHQIRTGSITWQLNRGIPPQVVAKRVNTSVRVIKKHYDKPDKFEEMEERRREHLDDLTFGENGGADR